MIRGTIRRRGRPCPLCPFSCTKRVQSSSPNLLLCPSFVRAQCSYPPQGLAKMSHFRNLISWGEGRLSLFVQAWQVQHRRTTLISTPDVPLPGPAGCSLPVLDGSALLPIGWIKHSLSPLFLFCMSSPALFATQPVQLVASSVL